jgi:hypothetical protein
MPIMARRRAGREWWRRADREKGPNRCERQERGIGGSGGSGPTCRRSTLAVNKTKSGEFDRNETVEKCATRIKELRTHEN